MRPNHLVSPSSRILHPPLDSSKPAHPVSPSSRTLTERARQAEQAHIARARRHAEGTAGSVGLLHRGGTSPTVPSSQRGRTSPRAATASPPTSSCRSPTRTTAHSQNHSHAGAATRATIVTAGTDARLEGPDVNSFKTEVILPEVPPLPTFLGQDSIISDHCSSFATSNASLLSVPLSAAAPPTVAAELTSMTEVVPSVTVEALVVAKALRPADMEPPAAAVVEDSALSECATIGTSLLSIPAAGAVGLTVMESQMTAEDSSASDCYISGATSSTSLLSVPKSAGVPLALVAEPPPHAAPPSALMLPQGTTEDMLLHPAPVKSVQPVFEASSAQASPMNSGGSEDVAAALRFALMQVVEEAKACLVAEQQAEDARAEAGDEEEACVEAEHETNPHNTNSSGDATGLEDQGLCFISAVECVTHPAEAKHLGSFAVVDDCSSTACTVSISATTMTTPTNADAAAATAIVATANWAAATEAEPEAESEAEVDAYAEAATDLRASTIEVELAQEMRIPLGDFHGLASTTSGHSDCNMVSSLAEDQTSQAQVVAEEHCSPRLTSVVHSDGTEEHCSPHRTSIVDSDSTEEHCSPPRTSIAHSEGTEEHCSLRIVHPDGTEERCSESMSSNVHSEGRQECRARDSGDFGEVMPLVTPERGADAGRKAELACAVTCSVHEAEHETPGLTSQMAKKSKPRESMTLVAFDLVQRAKETVPARCDIAPRRVSVAWMLRRGWCSTGGGASPVTATPPRLRQAVRSRSRKLHDGSAQANHRSDHLATVSSAAQKTACVLLGATCAFVTIVELAWRLGPDPELFS